MKTIAVFCGSRNGNNPEYAEKAAQLGLYLAENKIDIMYGAGDCGLMKALADAALGKGGDVHGLAYGGYDSHSGLTSVIQTEKLIERKRHLSKADGFIVMPGGFGTLDELFHVLGEAQAREHAKPIGFYNIRNYFAPLFQFIEQTSSEGFMRSEDKSLYVVDDKPALLVTQMFAKLNA
jgi:uncharacterized protein (TIGR00730 family)